MIRSALITGLMLRNDRDNLTTARIVKSFSISLTAIYGKFLSISPYGVDIRKLSAIIYGYVADCSVRAYCKDYLLVLITSYFGWVNSEY